jgi:hypothetical protein
MRSPVAALVAACFALSVSTPQVGVVVHHHADGELPHVHPGFEDGAHHHEWGTHDDHFDDDHFDDDHFDADHDGAAADLPVLRGAHARFEWHGHATSPFHRAALSRRSPLPRPHAVALLTIATPPERVAAASITSRSRAPPAAAPA